MSWPFRSSLPFRIRKARNEVRKAKKQFIFYKRRKANHTADAPEEDVTKKVGETDRWARLPSVALREVLKLLPAAALVSAGQTCSEWRAAAKDQSLWKERSLLYDPLIASTSHHDWHHNARTFARVIRFAPCLKIVRCNRGMKPAARKAVSKQSECEVRGAELNGQLVWSGQYMSKWRQQLVEVTLTNPNVDNLKLAVSLPRLETLSIHYVFNEYKLYYHVPELKGVRGCPSLKRLFCGKDVRVTAVEALINMHAATLEDVSVFGFPSALQSCTALSRIALQVDPAKDQQRLRKLLKTRRLDHLSFNGDRGNHIFQTSTCSSLRRALQTEKLVATAIHCNCCDSPRRDFFRRFEDAR